MVYPWSIILHVVCGWSAIGEAGVVRIEVGPLARGSGAYPPRPKHIKIKDLTPKIGVILICTVNYH